MLSAPRRILVNCSASENESKVLLTPGLRSQALLQDSHFTKFATTSFTAGAVFVVVVESVIRYCAYWAVTPMASPDRATVANGVQFVAPAVVGVGVGDAVPVRTSTRM